ncbi:glycosyltransferase [Aeromicrobium yanjiei]|uniref:glycosyltransferase n=1 Tax=Aeromicrobium yanjiei TaxID=2662028 RepID=UPI00188EDACC|nr:glycosyltransferase [Aeromicrobium yanjiei]
MVTFNPDMDRLSENINAVLPQVDELVIFDNASLETDRISAIAKDCGVTLLRAGYNNGLSHAYNRIFEYAASKAAQSILLLDQDSVCSDGMVRSLASCTEPETAIVSPRIVDRNLRDDRDQVPSGVAEVDHCITSGSLCSLEAWKAVGGYDERFFIDFTDFDFCLRLRAAGFLILKNNAVTLSHELGQMQQHGRVIAYNHSAFRNYHMARDMIFYARKHRAAPRNLKVRGRGVVMTYVVLLRKTAIVGAFEPDRVRRVSALIRGMISATLRRA